MLSGPVEVKSCSHAVLGTRGDEGVHFMSRKDHGSRQRSEPGYFVKVRQFLYGLCLG